MPAPLNVLLLGDPPAAPAHIARELRASFIDIALVHVTTPAAWESALRGRAFDAVVADSRLTWAPLRDIIAELAAAAPHCPFVLYDADGRSDAAADLVNSALPGGVVREDARTPRVAELLGRLMERAERRRTADDMRALVAALDEVLVVLDARGRCVRVAPSGAGHPMGPPQSLCGRTLHDLFGEPLADVLLGHVRMALETRQPQRAGYSLPLGGRQGFFEASVSPLDADTVLWVARDVTAHARAEKVNAAAYLAAEAVSSTRDLPDLLASIHAIVSDLMPARNFYIALDDQASQTVHFPYAADEFDPPPSSRRLGNGLTEYVLRTGRAMLASPADVQELIRLGEVEQRGTPSASWLGVPLVTEGRVIGVLAVQSYSDDVRYGAGDIEILRFVSTHIALAIERKRTETALRDGEERYRRLVEGAPVAMVVHEAGVIVFGNSAAERLLGPSGTGRLVGQPVLKFVHPDSRTFAAARMQQLDAGGGGVPLAEERFVRPDGSVIDAEVAAIAISWGGRPATLVTIHDVTSRKEAERALRRSEEQHRAIVTGVRDTIFALEVDGTITALNPAFAESTGWNSSEWLGNSIFRLIHPDDADAARQLFGRALNRELQPVGQLRLRTRSGSHRLTEVGLSVVYADGAALSLLGIARDITERVALEQRLHHTLKMEAVGQLAGGIAHDFNNLLTAVQMHVDLLLSALDEHDPRRADVDEIRRSAERAAGLTRQLLAYSRRQVLQSEVLDLNLIVRGADKLVRRLIGEDIRVVTHLAPSLGLVRADRGQLEQVIMNLAVNARDAMPEGGTLTMTTQDRQLDPADVIPSIEHSSGGAGPYIELTVSDTGVGMDSETRGRLFEPFFTTKDVGKGTGLGLSTAYGIVRQSGGVIWVESEPGHGATFHVALPRVDAVAAETAVVRSRARAATGRETILIAEDEPSVRAAGRTVLQRLGYRVLEAADGDAALQIASAHSDAIDLLFADVVMPKMNGRALAEELMRRQPTLRVLFTSGHTDRSIVQQGVLEPGLAFLAKPYTSHELGEKVRETLDRPPASALVLAVPALA